MAITVDTNIPAGNGVIDAIDGSVIRLRPDLRTTLEPWFWWHVRVRGCEGQRLRVVMGEPHTLTVRGAVVSRDQGRSWAWVPKYDPSQWEFEVEAGEDDELRLALSIPYTRHDLDAWLAVHDGHPSLSRGELCRSRSGASVPLLRVGNLSGKETRQAVITCRHHACESLASFVLEGLLDAVLADDETGQHLARTWCFQVVPQVDFDGVQAGDQGKSRAPHDHNRDYGPLPPVHPETEAIKDLFANACDHRLHLALDLHCPWVREAWNEHIYIVGHADSRRAELQMRFARLIVTQVRGPLPYRAADTLPHGTAWNVGSLTPASSFGRYASTVAPDTATVATMEFPYAEVEGHAVTAEGARAHGRAMARAIVRL
ncbi:MAG: hypothetical protein JJU29_21430 [Verrucomicrobia bacterium]|nr:hypothetical protein [Verrucomicrobiota bacterium]MCH8511615.1 hypothetical protein [Kiritimatiellia bacterium]